MKEYLSNISAILIRVKDKNSFIDQMKELCSFPNNLIMEKYMDQQGWSVLDDVTMIGLSNVNDFSTFKVDVTFEGQAPSPHIQCLLLLHNWMSQELSYLLYEDDVLAIPNNRLKEYYGSPEYHVDLKNGLSPKRPASALADDAWPHKSFVEV
jgi:hypothetical protein